MLYSFVRNTRTIKCVSYTACHSFNLCGQSAVSFCNVGCSILESQCSQMYTAFRATDMFTLRASNSWSGLWKECSSSSEHVMSWATLSLVLVVEEHGVKIGLLLHLKSQVKWPWAQQTFVFVGVFNRIYNNVRCDSDSRQMSRRHFPHLSSHKLHLSQTSCFLEEHFIVLDSIEYRHLRDWMILKPCSRRSGSLHIYITLTGKYWRHRSLEFLIILLGIRQDLL